MRAGGDFVEFVLGQFVKAVVKAILEEYQVSSLTGEQEDEDPEVAHAPKTVRACEQPTPEILRQHQCTHLPYQPWCGDCVAGRGRDRVHRAVVHEEVECPVVEMDYTYMKTRDDDAVQPVLVAVEKKTGFGVAVHCVQKGPQDVFAIRAVLQFFLEADLTSALRLRTDQEPSVQALAQAVAPRRTGMTVVELTPVRSSSSLGSAERFIQSVAGLVRTLKLALQRKFGRAILADSCWFPLLVRHAAWLLNRYQVRQVTHQTAFQMIQKRGYHNEVFEFGDCLMGRWPNALQQPKGDARWIAGLWLGRCPEPDEHLLATRLGILRTRTVQRTIFPQRITQQLFDAMVWTPRISKAIIPGEGG